MAKEHLEKLLSDVERLRYPDFDEAEVVKRKVVEYFKVLYPREIVNAGSIERLEFKAIWYPITDLDKLKHFDSVRNKLSAYLQAKIDVLKLLQDTTDNLAKLNAKKSAEQTIKLADSQASIKKLLQENKNLKASLEELEGTNQNNELVIIDQDETIKLNKEIIAGLEAGVKQAKRMRIFKDLGLGISLLSGAFFLGGLTVGIKIDYEKRRLQEQVDKQKTTIDSLNRNIKKINSEKINSLK